MSSNFLNVDLLCWIYGTVKKTQNGIQWNDAWKSTYREIGGTSLESGKKSCPMNASRILYQMGRLKDCGINYKDANLEEIWLDSKNGVYALIAINLLYNNKSIDYKQLQKLVYAETVSQFNSEPKSDQGAIRLTLMLWKLGIIQY